MHKGTWLTEVAVSHYTGDMDDYGCPVTLSGAFDSRTEVSADGIQFGFCVYEGMRAYALEGQYLIFRSKDHHARLIQSCDTLGLPHPSFDVFVDAISQVIKGNYQQGMERLYLRPIVYANSGGIMPMRGARSCTFAVVCAPLDVANGEISVLVESDNPRTVPMFMNIKTASNYASSSIIQQRANDAGYSTVLWLDSFACIQECTTMNIFVVIDGEIITPMLGSILPGVTRKTAINLLKRRNISVREESLTIDTVVNAARSGRLSHMFTTSTALGINTVARLGYGGSDIPLSLSTPEWLTALIEDHTSLTARFSDNIEEYQDIYLTSTIGRL